MASVMRNVWGDTGRACGLFNMLKAPIEAVLIPNSVKR